MLAATSWPSSGLQRATSSTPGAVVRCRSDEDPGRETRRRGSDHGPRRAAGGRLWRCGTTRRRDRHGATVGRVRPNSRWPSCWRSPTRRRPNGSTRSSNGASARRPRRIAGRWTPATSSVARVVGGGDGQRRAPDGGGALNVRRLLRGASAGGPLRNGGRRWRGSAWAARRSSPSTCGCRCQRCVRIAGPTCSPARDVEGPETQRQSAIRPDADPEAGNVPAGRTAGGSGRDRDRPLGRMMPERRWRVAARGRGLFAIDVDVALRAAGAAPDGGVPGDARRRGRTRGRCRRRLTAPGTWWR